MNNYIRGLTVLKIYFKDIQDTTYTHTEAHIHTYIGLKKRVDYFHTDIIGYGYAEINFADVNLFLTK